MFAALDGSLRAEQTMFSAEWRSSRRPIALPQPGKFRKFTEPSTLAFEANRPFTSIDDPSSELRDAKLNERNAGTEAGHGAGMHSTPGAVERLRFENVCEPEQPLNW